jgi:hypothetical protein
MAVFQIVVLDVLGCELRHQLDYCMAIQIHGLRIFVVELPLASLVIVDQIL